MSKMLVTRSPKSIRSRNKIPRRRFLLESLEKRELLASDLLSSGLTDAIQEDVVSESSIIDHSLVYQTNLVAEGEGGSISDSGGFEGSQQRLDLGSKGNATVDYSYEHFTIPDNFIIRYEGNNLLETGFVGGSSSGEVRVPAGDDDFVEVIVATDDSGTAWNYSASASGCGNPDPLLLDLGSSEFMAEEGANGETVCKGSGTLSIGRSDGIGSMLRVTGATAEYDDKELKVSGTVFSEIGDGEVLTKPLFVGSFTIPFATANSSAFSETAGGSEEYQLGGLPVDFSSISVNPNSIALGASFELIEDLGLPDFLFSGSDGLIITQNDVRIGSSIKFSAPKFENFDLFGFLPIKEFSGFSIEYIAAQDALKIQGKLIVDLGSKSPVKTFTVDLADPNFIQIQGGDVDIVGSLSVETNLKFPPNGWGLEELKLTIDTIAKDVGGSAKLTLPFKSVVETTGEVGFKLPIPPLELNTLGLEVDNLNVAIPAYPLVFFQAFRGQVTNFAPSDNDPIEFSGGVSATLGPQVSLPVFGTSSLVRADVDGKISAEMLNATGTITIISDKIATGSRSVTLDWEKKEFESTGSFNLFDGFVTTSAAFKATSQFNITMGGVAEVGIPDFIPIVGGSRLANGNFLFDFSNNGNSSDDFAAGWGAITIRKFGFEANFVAGAKLFFDGSVERIGSKNIPPVGSFDIPADTPWFVMAADWENSTTEDVPLIVELPDGTRVEEADFADHNIAVVEELSDDTTKVVIVFDADPGIWDLEVADPTGLGEVSITAAEQADAPTVSLNSAATNSGGGSVAINYSAADPDSDAMVRLFYDDDASGFDGIEIGEGVAEVDGDGSFVWDTTGVPNGDYFVYAMVFDGDNPPVYSYSSEQVNVAEFSDLATSTAVQPDSITVGDDVTVSFTVQNDGDATAANSQASITMPDGVTVSSTSLVPTSVDGSTYEFDLGDLAADDSTEIEFVVVAPDTAAILDTRIFVSTDTFDASSQNDVDLGQIIVNAAPLLPPNLAVSLDGPSANVELGENYSYTLKIDNTGDGPATGVELREQLPANARFILANASQGSSSQDGDGVVNVSFGDIPAGDSVTVVFTSQATTAGALISTTSVTSNEEDLETLNNFLITVNSANSTAPTTADLRLSVTSSATNASIDDEISIVVTINNEGPGIASGIMVDSPLPAQLELINASPDQGTYDAATGVWSVGNVRDGISRSLTLTARVVGSGQISESFEIAAVSESDPDSTPGNGDLNEDDIAEFAIQLGSQTVFLTPSSIAGLHIVEPTTARTAIIFQAKADATIRVLPVRSASASESVLIYNRDVEPIGLFDQGATTATLDNDGLYAIIFEPQSIQRIFSVSATGTSGLVSLPAQTNIFNPTDTNVDGRTTAMDALVIVNEIGVNQIGRSGSAEGEIAEGELFSQPLRYLDVNADGSVTALDALMVINHLARSSASSVSAESEQLLAFIANDEADADLQPDVDLDGVGISISAIAIDDGRASGIAFDNQKTLSVADPAVVGLTAEEVDEAIDSEDPWHLLTEMVV